MLHRSKRGRPGAFAIVYINGRQGIIKNLCISNPFAGKLLYKVGKLKTTNKERKNHGFRLSSVKKAIAQYNGTINIHHTDKVFYVDVLIYNPVNTFLDEKL